MKQAQIVWFKRDLRILDHGPLSEAANRGSIIPLYIIEPAVIKAADYSGRHWEFTRNCLLALRRSLANLGQPLIVRKGTAIHAFKAICEQFEITAVYAPEETGNEITFERDQRVRRWLKNQGIPLIEMPNNGVVRGLKNRDDWQGIRDKRMRQPIYQPPKALQPIKISIGEIPTCSDIGLSSDPIQQSPSEGETAARETLLSFLNSRGQNYVKGMSSPLTAFDACSRLSPYLAQGVISSRVVLRVCKRPSTQLAPFTVQAFESRLAWRDHFIQKLEMEPEIEYQSYVRAFDQMRSFDAEKFERWATGQTGYPFVDACMRCLQATGWQNFRMRAMLISFAAHELWLPWQKPALHLAKLFTDYEPGIHYPQIQMQSGTTGNKTLRIYDSVKQSITHDPEAKFIKKWVPELRDVPAVIAHTPWKSMVPIRGYIPQIVNRKTAVSHARSEITRLRSDPLILDEIAAVHEKHGSRKPSRQKFT
ncbi:MAG: deoxyribodipyrimidine photo-lyase [Chloroflexota bacterium]